MRISPPRGLNTLESKYKLGSGGIWWAGNGLQVRPGINIEKTQSNPAYTGPILVTGPKGPALYSYADHAGNNDDEFTWQETLPSPIVQRFTTIIWFRAIGYGGTNYYYNIEGHKIAVHDTGRVTLGYDCGNGYSVGYYNGTARSGNALNRDICIVVSSKSNTPITLSVDGSSYTPNSGLESYIGGGNIGSTRIYKIETTEFPNYYHLKGYVYLWGLLPGVFLDTYEANQITANPWSLYNSKYKTFYQSIPSSGPELVFSKPLIVENGEMGQLSTIIPPENLGTETPNDTKFLRGDGVWAVPTVGADVTAKLELNNLGGL